MKTIIIKILVMVTPISLILLLVLVSSALAKTENLISKTFNATGIRRIDIETFINNVYVYLPIISKPWSYLPVTPPIPSTSYYISEMDNSELYELGCSQGQNDLVSPGIQNSIVVLFFGKPAEVNGIKGVYLHKTGLFKTTNQIQQALMQYASGYWACVDNDPSFIYLAAGVNSQGSSTNWSYGQAWASMLMNAEISLQSTIYHTRVSFVGAANMELGFNSPDMTRAFVDGYDDYMYDPIFGSGLPIYNVGDAQGCAPFWGDCGSVQFTDWDTEDVWYISSGCDMCKALPMIYHNVDYTHGFIHARQWQAISQYSVDHHGYND